MRWCNFCENQTQFFPDEIPLNWFNLKHIFAAEGRKNFYTFFLLALLTITMFSKVLWASLFLISSQRMEQRAYCALGYDILRFNSMNQIILSDRWSDLNWIKESNFPWIIEKAHSLFLFSSLSTSCSELVKKKKAALRFFWAQHWELLNNPFYFYFYRCVRVQIGQRWWIAVMFVNNSFCKI